jgi:hypothetical protein
MRQWKLFDRRAILPSVTGKVASVVGPSRTSIWPWRAVLLGLGLLLGMALVATAQAQSGGVLEGQVVNGTAGAPEVGEGIPVVLHVYLGDSEMARLEAMTGSDGRFRFDDLDTDPNLEYWPEATYLDVPYTVSAPLQFEDGQSSLSITLTVYETTSDDAAIGLSSVHSIVESFGEVLRITEIHLLSNTGDRAYIGGGEGQNQGATVLVPLPDTAVGLSFGDGTEEGRFVETEGGVMDTAPVPPGSETSMIFFSYHVPATGDTIRLERRFAYPVGNLNMLVAQPGLSLRSEQLQSMGLQLFQDRQYELFVLENLEAGTPLTLEFIQVADASAGGIPGGSPSDTQGATGSPRGNQGVLLWIGFGLAGLAIVGAIVYSTTSARPLAGAQARRNVASDPTAQRLLSELAELQEALEAGQVDEATYESQRTEIYGKLKSL